MKTFYFWELTWPNDLTNLFNEEYIRTTRDKRVFICFPRAVFLLTYIAGSKTLLFTKTNYKTEKAGIGVELELFWFQDTCICIYKWVV